MTRYLFIGLDAFDPHVLRRGAAAGEFPALARLLERGQSIETETDPGTFVGSQWATIHTGETPGRHGLYCWAELVPGTYDIRMSDERNIEAPSFWTRLSRAGIRSAIVDVPHTKLDPEIDGIHVVNWYSHFKTLEGFATAPAALAKEIERRFGLDPVPRCNDAGHTLEGMREFTEHMLGRVERRTEFVLELLQSGEYDLVTVCYGESHCTGHQCYHLHDPQHPNFDRELSARLGDPVMRVYRAIDRAVGRLLDACPPDCEVLLLASHGMGPHYDGSHLAERLLRRVDWHLRDTPPIPLGRRILDLIEGNRLRRYLGPFARLLPALPRRAHARAFFVPNNEAYLGIRVNLAGREPAGLVAAGDYDRFLDGLERAMMSARRQDGIAAFTHAIRTAKFYGIDPHTSMLPDLMLAWDRSGEYDMLEVPGMGRIRGKYHGVRSGDHMEGGLAVFASPAGRRLNLPERLKSEDIAPQILSFFGVERQEPGRPARDRGNARQAERAFGIG